jgi:hypothetical protein
VVACELTETRSESMGYRAGPCTFCDGEGSATCPRCQGWVCASHAVGEAGHCGACARELKDDLEERQFARQVGHSNDDQGMFAARGHARAPLEAVQHLTDAVGGWFDERAVRKAFDERSAEDIAAWRRRAGMFVRSAG